jgi:beta-glucanase (GH16 family)
METNLKLSFQIFVYIITISGNLFCQSWELVWSDEFNTTILDESSWTREVGWNDGWGNNELQYYTNRDVNSFLENGNLVIQALNENFGGKQYTSARLKTQNKQFFKYGKFEASMKLPYGQGLWPAFWMLGQNFSTVGWPDCGEIDIMEMIGGQGREKTVHGTVHWDNNGQHAQYGGSYTLGSGIFSDDFHIFSITWDPQEIKWYVDGNLFHVFDITPQLLSEFHQDFFFILNVAVGGNWPGPPDASTEFPQRMEVDYVRVYKMATDVNDESHVPNNFDLFQNYPNPFNPETTITYALPSDSHVRMNLYNSLGEKVSELVNQVKPVGSHNVVFNANNFPSGVYYYEINAIILASGFSNVAEVENQFFSETKKMILLR